MKKTQIKNGLWISIVLIAAILVAGCTNTQSATLSVASKGFAEQFILGEMYALLLEDAGFTVDRKGALGGTPVLHASLINDELDIYPEYTGTGLLTVLQMDVMTNADAVFEAVSDAYLERFNLVWLDPAPMNNTQALAMTEERAAELAIVTFSDLATQAPDLVLAGPPEFAEREDGLPGLQAVYSGYEFSNYLAVDFGLRYPTLLSKDADVVVAFGTDGEIYANGLRVLVDDKGLYPPYQVAPVVRQSVLDENPIIAETLNKVAPLLDDATMQELNNLVTGEGAEPEDVARDFLIENGLIDG
ncbi:MAG: quaternary ammonium transporter [Anaerolineales bacterium]|nr:quaternary ammonium transporter [Chloroflexota bacterium]MBL6982435.1 quaternary ammonium transporter [Anaerolineales bacterium]